jgi:hypothetical protein
LYLEELLCTVCDSCETCFKKRRICFVAIFLVVLEKGDYI